MNPGPEADRVLLVHMCDCLDRIFECTNAEHSRFDASCLVRDAVIRNAQTAESSQHFSSEIQGVEPNGCWAAERPTDPTHCGQEGERWFRSGQNVCAAGCHLGEPLQGRAMKRHRKLKQDHVFDPFCFARIL